MIVQRLILSDCLFSKAISWRASLVGLWSVIHWRNSIFITGITIMVIYILTSNLFTATISISQSTPHVLVSWSLKVESYQSKVNNNVEVALHLIRLTPQQLGSLLTNLLWPRLSHMITLRICAHLSSGR